MMRLAMPTRRRDGGRGRAAVPVPACTAQLVSGGQLPALNISVPCEWRGVCLAQCQRSPLQQVAR